MKEAKSLFSIKANVAGRWVAVMEHRRADRALKMSAYRTRCFRKHEIHEFLVCAADADTTIPIDQVAYLGFGEICQGGVAEVGDLLQVGDRQLGRVLGFDETHVPNHYNIVIASDQVASGAELRLPVDAPFTIGKDPVK